MAITTIQCKDDSGILLYPQISSEQIIFSDGKNFQDGWNLIKEDIFKSMYPVGSILILQNNINLNELFPNTIWEKTSQGKILVGKGYLDGNASSTLVENNESVNSAYHVQITTSTMPSHNHRFYQRVGVYLYTEDDDVTYDYKNSGSNNYVLYRGGGGYHSNIMPYITANIWTRVA